MHHAGSPLRLRVLGTHKDGRDAPRRLSTRARAAVSWQLTVGQALKRLAATMDEAERRRSRLPYPQVAPCLQDAAMRRRTMLGHPTPSLDSPWQAPPWTPPHPIRI
uniref:Uncharacterized protein n=1 Tax=Plectus sambesii TaxID=2011161 RepID=A0A914VHW2_9BILA